MKQFENMDLEFKEIYVADIKKEVIAFANSLLSDEGIREMIVEVNGDSYESCRSMNQNLTFETLQEEMKKRNLDIGPAQMRTLHFVGEDGLYTNLALLLSEQCEHTIKVAIFQGSDKAVFRDRKEFSGSLLKQLNEAFQLIDLVNKTKASFDGLERVDKRDYPMEAVREALLNCVVHRDYSFSGSTLLNIYDDRMEFVSLGGLVPGISMEAIFMGVSQPRNVNLASVFYRMKLIESYGTGIGKICRMYAEEPSQPQFDTAKGAFRVILPNCNEQKATEKNYVPEISMVKERRSSYYAGKNSAVYYTPVPSLTDKERIMQYAREQGRVKRKDVEQLLGLKQTRAFNLLQELCKENKLRSVGKGRSNYYEVVR